MASLKMKLLASLVGLIGGFRILKTLLKIQKRNKIKKIAKHRIANACIIGGGVSGICTAIKLKEAGIPFKVFEQSHEAGGTWLDNDYPAAACDVVSYAYSFSFDRYAYWTEAYARRDELLAYFLSVAKRFGVYESFIFKKRVISCTFFEDKGEWLVTYEDLNTGSVYEESFAFVVSAVGQLNLPKIPEIPGKDSFKGVQFHSARWNHEASLAGKKVIAVGTGPSAIQAWPEVAKECEKLTILQRSTTYFIKKENTQYGTKTGLFFDWFPGGKLLRYYFILLLNEMLFYSYLNDKITDDKGNEIFTKNQIWFQEEIGRYRDSELDVNLEKFQKNNENLIKSEAEAKEEYSKFLERKDQLKKLMSPESLPGCKRVGLSDNWYATLMRKNVDVVEAYSIKEVKEKSVVIARKDGKEEERAADVIIWATGFHTTSFASSIQFTVVKKNGEKIFLDKQWGDFPKAYKGVVAENFPNLYMLYGPNTNLGHSSIIFMTECEVGYAVRHMENVLLKQAKGSVVKRKVFDEYNEDLQKKLQQTTFTGQCSNWYRTKSGHHTNMWYSGIFTFQFLLSKDDEDSYTYIY